uniref:Putative secreted protein n=1 Tax=Anopheles darlingi TaxID=43151 RepID=A0A2M4D5M6_ANODA
MALLHGQTLHLLPHLLQTSAALLSGGTSVSRWTTLLTAPCGFLRYSFAVPSALMLFFGNNSFPCSSAQKLFPVSWSFHGFQVHRSFATP